ncbi:transporter, major facilitator family protein [Dictyocaulus viviparus]|uniref:Transporter, major facilitator family protein n=1 Tax=Dictyocaulus viviparus TaxID=29172 RepID=A0A0D8XX35_DICVI|nr:transporter, major facilitator family protein [Dictyocaulus viviparus]
MIVEEQTNENSQSIAYPKNMRSQKERKIPRWRYVIVVLATSISAIGLSCSFAFNFASICKVDSTKNAYETYQRSPSSSPIMYFSAFEMSLIYSAYPFGHLCMLIFMMLYGEFRRVRCSIFISCLLSSLTTILVPPLYDLNPHTTLVLKIIQGAAVAPNVPLVGHVTAHWTSRTEMGMFVSLLTSYSQVGLFFLMSTSGVICEWFSWREIFYFNGLVSLLISVLWVIFFRDYPLLSDRDDNEVDSDRRLTGAQRQAVPYRAFFTSVPVLSCLVAAFGNFGGISVFMTFAPSILKKALNMSDLATSQYNTISFVLQLSLKLFSGKLSDIWISVSECNKVRVFNSFSVGLAGVLAICTSFVPAHHQVVCATLITLFQGIIGFNAAGYNKAAVIIARQYAYFLFTCFGLILTFVTLLQPLIGKDNVIHLYLVAPESRWDQWCYLLFGHGLLLVISNVIFCVFVRVKPAAFTQSSLLSDGL